MTAASGWRQRQVLAPGRGYTPQNEGAGVPLKTGGITKNSR